MIDFYQSLFKSNYEFYVEAINSEGLVYQSFQTVEVTDTNDKPVLSFSHANNYIRLDDIGLESRSLIGIKEEIENPYVMTLSMIDQDLNDSYTIEITYQQLLGSYYDAEGDLIYTYDEEVVNITDLFNFKKKTKLIIKNWVLLFLSIYLLFQ